MLAKRTRHLFCSMIGGWIFFASSVPISIA